ncbi:metal transporter [Haloarcula sp. CBA1130]|uniref:PDGLE domain-containing protein n=1 Tax=unclassified Haloarcula TaxID=2624677 RepID=UPI001248DB7D|nr:MULTISPECIES: PDGLE domain-containing protein [unclassified Haloarcula]KAA9399749.1 metal transporter [Haloarcula sp. CBA1129]KAA9401445.1 metal transporter [Haloarcula sp. CBA1130]
MVWERPDWLPHALAALLVLTLLTPVFGWAAGQVGYAEPLENAAETTGATDHATAVGTALFPDYGVPGLGGAPGTFVSAVVGTALTLLVGAAIGRALGTDTETRQ